MAAAERLGMRAQRGRWWLPMKERRRYRPPEIDMVNILYVGNPTEPFSFDPVLTGPLADMRAICSVIPSDSTIFETFPS
jgi:hypothetical protein